MFEKLDLNKTMYFKDGQAPKTYRDALLEISFELGLTGDLNIPALEAKIKETTTAEATALSTGVSNPDHAAVVAFHRWVVSIHNDNLGAPPGARFPNNIVYDMLSNLRNDSNPQAQDVFLRFFLEGLNGRKINKGETPSLDFISTSFLLQVLSKLSTTSSVARDFQATYDSTSAFVEPQKQLESSMTEAKKGALFGFLSSELKDAPRPYVLDFPKDLKKDTGANAYGLNTALTDGLERLSTYPADKLNADTQSMVQDLEKRLETFVQSVNNAKASQPARLLALWDASEFVCRAIVVLQIAAKIDPKHEAVLNRVMADPIISEVHQRSLTGNFPGKARNDAIARIEVVELFQQANIAADARTKKRAIL